MTNSELLYSEPLAAGKAASDRIDALLKAVDPKLL